MFAVLAKGIARPFLKFISGGLGIGYCRMRHNRFCNAVRIFDGIVRRGLWHHITQEQEDWAVQVLKRYREKQAAKCSGLIEQVVEIGSSRMGMNMVSTRAKKTQECRDLMLDKMFSYYGRFPANWREDIQTQL